MKNLFLSKQTLAFVLFCLGFTFSLSLPFTPLAAQSWSQQGAAINAELAGDQSGYSVSLSDDGTTVAIGAINNDGGGSNSGHVRVYKLVSGTWTQQGADINGEAANDNSGRSVSLSSDGTTVAIGAPFNDGGGAQAGHVRVYKLVTGTWTQQGADINGAAADDYCGYSVSLSDDGATVAIGANQNDGGGSNSGHVRVYKLVTGTWTLQGAAINGEAANDESGRSVSLSDDGTTVAIGAPFNAGGGSFKGYVRVYKLVTGIWTLQGAAINGEADYDRNGASVSLSYDGTTVAIGADQNDGNGSNSGHVRVYKLVTGTWTQQGADINGAAALDLSGYSVSLSDDGTIVAIGAIGNDGGGSNSGHVRVYKLVTGTWTLQDAAINGAAADDQSGYSVSLSDDGATVAIGANLNDGNGTNSGHVRVFYNAGVLPVELLDFTGKNTEGGNLLTWQTANEVNNKGFEIQKLHGNDWQNIGFVNGNNKAATYNFTDNAPLPISTYRLRQIDFDGKETYSKALSIQPNGKGKVKIYPTVTSGNLTIEGAKSFELINAIGQVVLRRGLGSLEGFLSLSHLPNGIYILKGVDTEGGVFSEKIIKQ